MIASVRNLRAWLHKEFSQGLFVQRFVIMGPLLVAAFPLAFWREAVVGGNVKVALLVCYALAAFLFAAFWIWQSLVVCAERREKFYQKHVKPMLSSEYKNG